MTTPQNDKGPKIPDNEFRISPKTNIYFALERIEKAFKTFDHIVLSGINAGISRVLLIAEITKLKIGVLHQYNFLETMITEIKEETSDKTVEKQKFRTRFKVELYKTKPTTAPKGFYQAPYTEEELKKLKEFKGEEKPEGPRRGGFRGRGANRGRGSRGGRNDGERGGRGAPRGRGRNDGERGGRGRGRGRGDERRRGGERGERSERGRPREEQPKRGGKPKKTIPGL